MLLAFAAASAALMWIWNTLGHDLLGAPEASYRHGMAAAMGYMLLYVLFRSARRSTNRNSHNRPGTRGVPQ